MTGAASAGGAPPGRLTFTQGVSAIRVLNWDALFADGVCARCGMARGPRTDEPVRFRHVGASGPRSDGWLAGGSPPGPKICLYSERFLALLTDEERGLLHWRPAENTAFGDGAVWELAGAAHHLPLVRPRGGSPYLERCGECGWEPPPHYASSTTQPDWMMRFARAGGFLPPLYAAAADLPHPVPAAFTVGDARESLLLVLHPARWAELMALRGKRRLRGVQGWDLGVLPAELVEG